MRMKRTWNDNVTNLVRQVFFPCEELKDLLLIPRADREDLAAFVDKYFLNDPTGEE